MLLLWLYLCFCTARAVPSLDSVLLLTKDQLRNVLLEQNQPALTAAAEVLWTNDVIGDYLMDPEFPELLTGLGLTVMAMFVGASSHHDGSGEFIRNVRGE